MKPASPSLLYLISICMLERTSFYGVRGVLLLYLTKSFMRSPAEAFEIAGLMFSLSLFISLIIGAMNDKLHHLGQVLVAGLFSIFLGTVLLMFHNPSWFLLSIAWISLGSGAIRATIPTLLSKIEGKNRSELYTYLYIANNVGALLGTGVCGIIGEVFGWNWGFALSGIMLLIGGSLVLYKESRYTPDFFPHLGKIFALLLPLLMLLWVLLDHRELAIVVILSSFILALGVGGYIQARNGTWKDFTYLLLLLSLLLLFSIFYEQGGLSLVLLTDALVDRSLSPALSHFFGVSEIPVTLFSNIDATANIFIGLFLAYLYKKWSASESRAGYLSKFIMAFGFAWINFLILTRILQSASLVPAGLVVMYYVLFVCGEQLAYPVAMAATVTLSPEKNRSFFLSLLMTAIAVGGLLAAEVAKWMHPEPGTPFSASISLYRGYSQQALYFLSAVIIVLLIGRFLHQRTTSAP